jgi:Lon protease-like protein
MPQFSATRFGTLPETIPIFPLSGAVLLPGGTLPLYIFEPRYRHMIADARAGDNMIGMVQPQTPMADPLPEGAEIFDVGCVGEIARCTELEDGGYEILLVGLCRFDVHMEINGVNGYRRITADYTRFRGDLSEAEIPIANRAQLMEVLKAYLDANGIDAEMEDVARMPDQALVNALCAACPLELREKQALLEAADLPSRAELLNTLLVMAASPFANPETQIEN